MLFNCSGEFGDETIEATTIEEAAVKCAEAHAGLDCDEVCEDPFSFTVNDVEFSAEVTGRTLRVFNAGGVELD